MRTHISNFGIENFRVFKDHTHFEFAPITVLVGPNGSGKSSLTKALEIFKNEGIKQAGDFNPFDLAPVFTQKISSENNSEKIGDLNQALNFENNKKIISNYFSYKAFGIDDSFHAEFQYEIDCSNYFSEASLLQIRIRNNANEEILVITRDFALIDFNYFIHSFKVAFEKSQKVWIDFFDLYEEAKKRNSEQDISDSIEQLNKYVLEFKLDVEITYNDNNEITLSRIYGDQERGLNYFNSINHYNRFIKGKNFEDFIDVAFLSKLASHFQIDNPFEAKIGNKQKILDLINEISNYYTLKKWYLLEWGYFQGSSMRGIGGSINQDLRFDGEVFPFKAFNIIRFNLKDDSMFGEHDAFSFMQKDQAKQTYNNSSKSIIDTLSYIDRMSSFYSGDILCTDLEKSFYETFLFENLAPLQNEIAKRNQLYKLDTQKTNLSRSNYFQSDFSSSLFKNYFKEKEFIQKDILNFINTWVKDFKIANSVEFVLHSNTQSFEISLELLNGKKINIGDTGFGITRLLPIILACFKQHIEYDIEVSYSPSVIVIEEPESNLHPALQSKLADLFVDAAQQFNTQFIIETHSEYLIRKLQYLTAMKAIKPEDTVIYYFYPPDHPDVVSGQEPQVKKINIDEYGSLTDNFGNGFFDEASTWKFELLKLQNQKSN